MHVRGCSVLATIRISFAAAFFLVFVVHSVKSDCCGFSCPHGSSPCCNWSPAVWFGNTTCTGCAANMSSINIVCNDDYLLHARINDTTSQCTCDRWGSCGWSPRFFLCVPKPIERPKLISRWGSSVCIWPWQSSPDFPNLCYLFLDATFKADLTTASDVCNNYGANLPVLYSKEEYDSYSNFIKKNFNDDYCNNITTFWLGFIYTNEGWTSMENSSAILSYLPWAKNQTGVQVANCTSHSAYSPWSFSNCTRQRNFGCQRRLGTSAATAPTTTCPLGWLEDPNHVCYYFSNEEKSWFNAETFCESMDSTLPIFCNELDLFNFQELSQTCWEIWAGYIDSTGNGSFYWINTNISVNFTEAQVSLICYHNVSVGVMNVIRAWPNYSKYMNILPAKNETRKFYCQNRKGRNCTFNGTSQTNNLCPLTTTTSTRLITSTKISTTSTIASKPPPTSTAIFTTSMTTTVPSSTVKPSSTTASQLLTTIPTTLFSTSTAKTLIYLMATTAIPENKTSFTTSTAEPLLNLSTSTATSQTTMKQLATAEPITSTLSPSTIATVESKITLSMAALTSSTLKLAKSTTTMEPIIESNTFGASFIEQYSTTVEGSKSVSTTSPNALVSNGVGTGLANLTAADSYKSTKASQLTSTRTSIAKQRSTEANVNSTTSYNPAFSKTASTSIMTSEIDNGKTYSKKAENSAFQKTETNVDSTILIKTTEKLKEVCTYGEWSNFSECSATCGESLVRKRQKVVIKDGIYCPEQTDIQNCNLQACNPMSSKLQSAAAAIQTLGCSWMIGTLATSFVFSILFWSWNANRVLHASQELSLLLAHCIIALARSETKHKIICTLAGIGLQYFFIVSFTCLLLEAVHVFALVTSMVANGSFYSTKANVCIGWGLPAFVVAFTAVCSHDNYVSKFSCWLNFGQPICAATFIPVIMSCCGCLIMLETSGQFHINDIGITIPEDLTSAKISQKSLLFIMPLSFFAWLSGSYAIYEQNFGLFTTVFGLNLALGFSIIIFHVFANEQGRKVFQKMMQKVCNRK